MNTTETKPWWASRTIIGQVISILSMILGALIGIDFDTNTQALIVDQFTAAISAGVSLFGTVITIWGRFRATKAIG